RGPAAVDESPATAFDFGPNPEHVGRRALRVEVPEQYVVTALRRKVRQVYRGRCLAHAAFDVVRRVDLHQRTSAFTRSRFSSARNGCSRPASAARAFSWWVSSWAAISPIASTVSGGA